VKVVSDSEDSEDDNLLLYGTKVIVRSN
jgi:hypothetical protein